MFNAGTPQPQMSSCFLLQMQEDSIAGIFETLKCALPLLAPSQAALVVRVELAPATDVRLSTRMPCARVLVRSCPRLFPPLAHIRTGRLCAKISKAAGGIGLSATDIRATGSYIKGTGGQSNGLVPMLRVFDSTARYVDQGGGKRKGAFAVYLEPWHADVFSFLELRKNHGKARAARTAPGCGCGCAACAARGPLSLAARACKPRPCMRPAGR